MPGEKRGVLIPANQDPHLVDNPDRTEMIQNIALTAIAAHLHLRIFCCF